MFRKLKYPQFNAKHNLRYPLKGFRVMSSVEEVQEISDTVRRARVVSGDYRDGNIKVTEGSPFLVDGKEIGTVIRGSFFTKTPAELARAARRRDHTS